MHGFVTLDGSPSTVDGHYLRTNHGETIEISRDAYWHALALTQRIVMGASGCFLVAGMAGVCRPVAS
jgi:hypothetical protein